MLIALSILIVCFFLPKMKAHIDTVIGGRPEKIYGTACRQPDGSWKVQS